MKAVFRTVTYTFFTLSFCRWFLFLEYLNKLFSTWFGVPENCARSHNEIEKLTLECKNYKLKSVILFNALVHLHNVRHINSYVDGMGSVLLLKFPIYIMSETLENYYNLLLTFRYSIVCLYKCVHKFIYTKSNKIQYKTITNRYTKNFLL